MGRSTTFTYRLEMEGGDLGAHVGWSAKDKGKPSAQAIENYLVACANSMKIGGCNEHISRALGRLPILPRRARIVAQTGKRAGEVVAEWSHPPFFAF